MAPAQEHFADSSPVGPLADRVDQLVGDFRSSFPSAPSPIVVRAPGRINLIGEHTDYNDGFVLPVTIDRDTLVALAPRTDDQIHATSLTLERTTAFRLQDVQPIEGYERWSNYLRGVTSLLAQGGYQLSGADCLIASTVPVGAGLASSAALEVAVAFGLLSLPPNTPPVTPSGLIDLALLCQRVEHEFIGVNCGIMDQFIVTLGQAGNALFVDCRTLNAQLVPLPSDVAIVITDTGVKRGLAASQYNIRRQECEEGVRLLQPTLPGTTALRDVSPAQFRAYEHLLPEVIRRRCRHVVTENARVLAAIDALTDHDVATVGDLMNRSHDSLRDDYQVSCTELDILVDAARDLPSVLGSRMTGGGFGGCTVSLVRHAGLPEFHRHVPRAYRAKSGRAPRMYVCSATDGVRAVAW